MLFNDWQNGLSEGATLSEPVENFERVEFEFRTNDYDVFSLSVLQPSTSFVMLASCAKYLPSNGAVYLKTKAYQVDGASVSTQKVGSSYSCGQLNLTSGEFRFGDFVTIVKAIGWR